MFEFPLSKELRKKKVKTKFKEDIEPEEIFLDALSQKKEKELGISEKKFETPLPKNVLRGFIIFILILIFLLFAKTFQLQVIERKNLTSRAEANKFIIHRIQAERGVIYDKNFNQLVFNQPRFDLVYRKSEFPELESERRKILKEISQIIKLDPEELEKKILESETSLITIAENLDHQTLIILETKIDTLPGLRIVNNPVRIYKEGPIFAHLIGYTGKIRTEEQRAEPEFYSILDYIGREGLEKSYEKVLRRNPGKLRIEKDVQGREISREIISLPKPGKSLVLWLDSELQQKIFQELEKELKKIGSKKGVVVALDPKTGGVLSLVSYPSFDNNLFTPGVNPQALKNLLEDPDQALFNRAISGTYLPGSTIKPLIALAALEEKIISPQKKINCQGEIQVRHRYLPEIIYKFRDWKVHGWTDIKKAIAESSNVYFYHIGGGYGEQEGLGPSRIKHYLELFGWGKRTQIDLPGEAQALIPSPAWKKEFKKEGWWDGDTYLLSIGHGDILATPIQVASAFLAIANGGKLLKPQVVQKIVDEERNLIEEIEPKIIRENFINPKNLQIVREGMREAVLYGSAVILNDLPVKVAAKTGTAETSKKGIYHNWVTLFAPYEDPQIVLTVIIEEVKGIQPAALRVAKGVLEWYFLHRASEGQDEGRLLMAP